MSQVRVQDILGRTVEVPSKLHVGHENAVTRGPLGSVEIATLIDWDRFSEWLLTQLPGYPLEAAQRDLDDYWRHTHGLWPRGLRLV